MKNFLVYHHPYYSRCVTHCAMCQSEVVILLKINLNKLMTNVSFLMEQTKQSIRWINWRMCWKIRSSSMVFSVTTFVQKRSQSFCPCSDLLQTSPPLNGGSFFNGVFPLHIFSSNSFRAWPITSPAAAAAAAVMLTWPTFPLPTLKWLWRVLQKKETRCSN